MSPSSWTSVSCPHHGQSQGCQPHSIRGVKKTEPATRDLNRNSARDLEILLIDATHVLHLTSALCCNSLHKWHEGRCLPMHGRTRCWGGQGGPAPAPAPGPLAPCCDTLHPRHPPPPLCLPSSSSFSSSFSFSSYLLLLLQGQLLKTELLHPKGAHEASVGSSTSQTLELFMGESQEKDKYKCSYSVLCNKTLATISG